MLTSPLSSLSLLSSLSHPHSQKNTSLQSELSSREGDITKLTQRCNSLETQLERLSQSASSSSSHPSEEEHRWMDSQIRTRVKAVLDANQQKIRSLQQKIQKL